MSWKVQTRFGYYTGSAPSLEEIWPEIKDPKTVVEKARKIIEELKGGKYPSFIKEAEKSLYPTLAWAIGVVLGRSPWDTGASPVPGVYAGLLGRVFHATVEKAIREGAPEEHKKYEEQGILFAGKVYEVHARVLSPPAGFMSTTLMRTICEITDKLGWGLMQLRGGTGAMPIIHTDQAKVERLVMAIRLLTPTDVGGSGDILRTVTCCPGPATCPYAIYDTLMWWEETCRRFVDWATYPQFPYKIKFKFSGCPLDCIKAQVGADYIVIGTWLGAPQIDQEEFRRMVKTGEVDPKEVVEACPTGALTWDESTLTLKCDPRKCVKCMNCIIRAQPAIRPGKDRGVTILTGGSIKSRNGPKMGAVLIPFIRITPENEKKVLNWFLDLVEKKIVAKWADTAFVRERVGDLSIRMTWERFLKEVVEHPAPDLVIRKEPPPEPYYKDAIPFAMIPKDQKWSYFEALKKSLGLA